MSIVLQRTISNCALHASRSASPRIATTLHRDRRFSSRKMSGVAPNFTAALNASSDPVDKELVIRQVLPEIITFGKPFTRGPGMHIGGRTTIVKLPTGLFVYASTPLTPATKQVISEWGSEVKWIVTPDGEHAMYTEQYASEYPNAQPIGVERLRKGKPNIKWAYIFGEGVEPPAFGFEPDISLHQVSSHLNDELVAIHHPSETLIEGDMLFNLPAKEQYSRAGGLPFLAKLGASAMAPGGWVQGMTVSAIVKDKELVKKELAPIYAAKWDRLIPCHGDVIESGGRAAWDKVWAKYK